MSERESASEHMSGGRGRVEMIPVCFFYNHYAHPVYGESTLQTQDYVVGDRTPEVSPSPLKQT